MNKKQKELMKAYKPIRSVWFLSSFLYALVMSGLPSWAKLCWLLIVTHSNGTFLKEAVSQSPNDGI